MNNINIEDAYFDSITEQLIREEGKQLYITMVYKGDIFTGFVSELNKQSDD